MIRYQPDGRSLRVWGVITWLFVFSLVSYFDRTIMIIAGPEIMNQTGIVPAEMGIVYSAFTIGYTLFMVPGGRLVDRGRPELIIGVSTVLGGVLTLLTAVLGLFSIRSHMIVLWWLVIIRFLFGAVTAPLYPACSKITTLYIASTYHGRAQGIFIAGAPLGAAVSPLVFSAMMSRYSWPLSCCLVAAGTAILGMCWLTRSSALSSSSLPVTASVNLSVESALLKVLNRNLVFLTSTYFALGYFEGIFFYWIYYYLVQVRQTSVSEAARYTAILFVAMAIMVPAGGWLSDRLTSTYGARFGRRVVPISGLLLAAIFLYAGLASSSMPVRIGVAFFSLAIGSAASCEGPSWAALLELDSDTVGTSGSILNAGGMLGTVLSPIITPLIASRFGWSAGIIIGSCIVIMGIIAWLQFEPAPKSEAPKSFQAMPD